jgi:hypothetical protein
MSGGTVCKCGRRDAWLVTQYYCNHSAFSGYQHTPSDYSEVMCDLDAGGCGAVWRTKAGYVDELPRAPHSSR